MNDPYLQTPERATKWAMFFLYGGVTNFLWVVSVWSKTWQSVLRLTFRHSLVCMRKSVIDCLLLDQHSHISTAHHGELAILHSICNQTGCLNQTHVALHLHRALIFYFIRHSFSTPPGLCSTSQHLVGAFNPQDFTFFNQDLLPV